MEINVITLQKIKSGARVFFNNEEYYQKNHSDNVERKQGIAFFSSMIDKYVVNFNNLTYTSNDFDHFCSKMYKLGKLHNLRITKIEIPNTENQPNQTMKAEIQIPRNTSELVSNCHMRAAYYERMAEIAIVDSIPHDQKRELIEEMTSSIYMCKNITKALRSVENNGGALTWNTLPSVARQVSECREKLENLLNVLNGKYSYEFPMGVEQYPVEIQAEKK